MLRHSWRPISARFLLGGCNVAVRPTKPSISCGKSELNVSRCGTFGLRPNVTTASYWLCSSLTRADVAKRFEEFDEDGDGFLSPQEMQAVIDSLRRDINGGQILESLWTMDHNKDGLVDYHEFMDYFMGFNQEEDDTLSGQDAFAVYGPSPFSSWDVLLEYCTLQHGADLMGSKTRNAYMALVKEFRSLDLNGDGFLSQEELRTGLLKVHPDASMEQIKSALAEVMETADTNQDGQIDFYEFSSKFRPGFIQDIMST